MFFGYGLFVCGYGRGRGCWGSGVRGVSEVLAMEWRPVGVLLAAAGS